MKAAKYIVLFLILIQFVIPYAVPLDAYYKGRVDYQGLFKDNPQNYYPLLHKIKQEIKRDHLKDYAVIIGDSVAWSSPGPSKDSLAPLMEELAHGEGKDFRVFNLAMPSLQAGDIYTLLLMMDRYGISTDRVLINVRYAGFVKRNPGAAIVFWLKDDLKMADRKAFDQALPHLKANGYQESKGWNNVLRSFIENEVYTRIPMFAYKDAIVKSINETTDRLLNRAVPTDDSIGDIRNWRLHANLEKYIKTPDVVNSFNPAPFDMTEQNLQIYFMNKIIQHQQGTRSLFFLTGLNEGLLGDAVSDPSYQANMQAIDRYFAATGIAYTNLQKEIGEEDFADHTHYMPEGYRKLAALVLHHMPESLERKE
ncbi:hypothetical protein [Gorillibacterium massiliense]|uniref:hypothetical protein n=1 Tax=Gorillibacterium massiliense TaxID=1280390 RepID=UPI0004B87D91|nr:hypothetical protein [Gorillibacterium massiliense]